MLRKPRTALIGAGRMGSAMLRGWAAAAGFAPDGSIMVIDPHLRDSVTELVVNHKGRVANAANQEMFSKLETLILAVKPQRFEETAKTLAPLLPKDVLILSVIAGISLNRLENSFGPGPHVRAMPNTAAEIGQSISVLCPNDKVSPDALQRAEQILAAIGQVETIDDERLMDVVTAVSGSGPAYFFLLAEALAAAGQSEGLPEELAAKLASQTMIGAGALLQSRGQSPRELRGEVTSPGGTTAAALDVMIGNGAFAEIMRNAISAAARRSIKLRNSD
ncbi:MAG: pyrroline-5-carboxylate reductase [Robiginitomaculum sp.]|nr:MAG: pyrroline-5-carboxylate reductase [Robiginitomaculum sp.]